MAVVLGGGGAGGGGGAAFRDAVAKLSATAVGWVAQPIECPLLPVWVASTMPLA